MVKLGFSLVLIITLASTLWIVGCGGGETSTPTESATHTPTPGPPPIPPKAGEWIVTTQFGELGITVNPGGTSISTIAFYFDDFKCEGEEGSFVNNRSLSIVFTEPLPIVNSQFNYTTSDPSGTYRSVYGAFDSTGAGASGTWEIGIAGGPACSDTWEYQ